MEVTCRDVPPQGWLAALTEVRDQGFTFFDWLTAVDQTDAAEPGFDVVCHLVDPTSTGDLRRVLVRTRVAADGAVGSATRLWRGAAWHERETHEMFGVGFEGFDDGTGLGLRPLLLPEGFEGTPLRKSFVLVARASKPWPGAKEPGESSHDLAAEERAESTTGPATASGAGPGAPGEPEPAATGRPARPARPPRRRMTPPGVPDPQWGPR